MPDWLSDIYGLDPQTLVSIASRMLAAPTVTTADTGVYETFAPIVGALLLKRANEIARRRALWEALGSEDLALAEAAARILAGEKKTPPQLREIPENVIRKRQLERIAKEMPTTTIEGLLSQLEVWRERFPEFRAIIEDLLNRIRSTYETVIGGIGEAAGKARTPTPTPQIPEETLPLLPEIARPLLQQEIERLPMPRTGVGELLWPRALPAIPAPVIPPTTRQAPQVGLGIVEPEGRARERLFRMIASITMPELAPVFNALDLLSGYGAILY